MSDMRLGGDKPMSVSILNTMYARMDRIETRKMIIPTKWLSNTKDSEVVLDTRSHRGTSVPVSPVTVCLAQENDHLCTLFKSRARRFLSTN